MKISAFDTRDALMQATADRIAGALQEGLAKRGEACAALSGGSTPEPAYRLLAQKPLDWPNITFALVDERFVPSTDPASNESMIRRVLARALERGAKLKPLYVAAATAQEAAQRASALYQGAHYDIAVMGMGEDGHTASWFPGSDGLDAALGLSGAAPVVAVHAPQAAGATDRLTLTRAEIAKADSVLLLVTGEAKRDVLDAADGKPIETMPVAALFQPPLPPPEVFWAP